jgi:CRISPR-associated exonuclease Cas4
VLETFQEVNGTLMWYYFICPREVWLMARQVTPDADDPKIEIGRFIHENHYRRAKKEISVGTSKMDIIKQEDGRIVISEVKKSSRYLKSARMQLLYYLKQLKNQGVDAQGELLFPEERRKEEIQLTKESVYQLEQAEAAIIEIIHRPTPPSPKKIGYCRNCGYREYCWA